MSSFPEKSTLNQADGLGRLVPAVPPAGAQSADRGATAPAARASRRPRTIARVARWEWPAIAAILAVASGLNFYALDREGYANTYYAAAVRSMLVSWHNFFFVSFDPGGFVTVDKPPAGFWIQTISAKIFGYHGWSILLPQALAGVLSVALLWWLVRRAWNPAAGLIAAAALAVTPISVVTNRNNTIDSLLTLCVLGATWAVMRAIESPRHPLRWLLLGAALVGFGFNIKMLEAYLVVPALWLAYLVVAKSRWFMRVAHLAVASILLVAVSLSWATVVDLTPPSQRPYVGSSQTNSVLELALGYNGLQRLLGRTGRGGNGIDLQSFLSSLTAEDASGAGGPGGGGVGGASENGAKGFLRLLNAELGGQIGWLAPLAVVGLLAAAWQVRPRRLRFWRFANSRVPSGHGSGVLRRRRASVIIWGTWFLTMGLFFSFAGFFHRYYLTMLSPGAAALVGLGAVALWQAWRTRGWAGLVGLILPVALVGTAYSQRNILAPYAEWSARLATPILAVSIAAAAVLAVAWLLRRRGGRWAIRTAQGALAVGIAALLVAPAVWSGISVQAASEGRASSLPAAGPGDGGMGFGGGPGGAPPQGGTRGAFPGDGTGQNTYTGGDRNTRQGTAAGGATQGRQAGAGGQQFPGAGEVPQVPGGAQAQQPGQGAASPAVGQAFGDGGGMGQLSGQMLQWLIDHQGSARFIVAVSSSQQASSAIIEHGVAVMATGGFSGGDPILTADSIAQLVKDGTVRYFLSGGGMGGGGFGGVGGNTSFNVNTWVSQHCTDVPATEWGGTGTSQLYDCGTTK